jgi:hypothetical protein
MTLRQTAIGGDIDLFCGCAATQSFYYIKQTGIQERFASGKCPLDFFVV